MNATCPVCCITTNFIGGICSICDYGLPGNSTPPAAQPSADRLSTREMAKVLAGNICGEAGLRAIFVGVPLGEAIQRHAEAALHSAVTAAESQVRAECEANAVERNKELLSAYCNEIEKVILAESTSTRLAGELEQARAEVALLAGTMRSIRLRLGMPNADNRAVVERIGELAASPAQTKAAEACIHYVRELERRWPEGSGCEYDLPQEGGAAALAVKELDIALRSAAAGPEGKAPTQPYRCARCNVPCGGFVVPSDVWNLAVRLGGSERSDDLLCESCFRDAAVWWVREAAHAMREAGVSMRAPGLTQWWEKKP